MNVKIIIVDNDKLVKTNLEGMVFWYYPDDKFVGQRIAIDKYEKYESKLLLSQLKEGDVAVDVGANIGYYTLLMARKVGPKGKVFAYEPEEGNFSVLKKNIEDNNLSWVMPIKAAVGKGEEMQTLYLSDDNFGDHRVFDETGKKKKQVIQSVSLDKHLESSNKVNLLKIDTQGWEPNVIEGAKNIIRKYRPAIFLEYWKTGYEAANLNGGKMLKDLISRYSHLNLIDDTVNTFYGVDEIKVDLLCQKNRKEYVDLMIVNGIGFQGWILKWSQIRIKKIVKQFLGIETGY